MDDFNTDKLNTTVDQRQDWKTKWNWSGLVLGFAFGVGNRAWLSFLAFIPILNIVWIFVTGAQGEKWAKNNPKNEYRDEVEFRRIMDSWNRAGFVQFIIAAVVMVIYFFVVASVLSNGYR